MAIKLILDFRVNSSFFVTVVCKRRGISIPLLIIFLKDVSTFKRFCAWIILVAPVSEAAS